MTADPYDRIERVRLELWGFSRELIQEDRLTNAYGLALRHCAVELGEAVKELKAKGGTAE